MVMLSGDFFARKINKCIYVVFAMFFAWGGSFTKSDESTPPKFNMEPENDGFQKASPFPGTSFQVQC